jgi:5-bromo-4-chloroindolyl phosphate hydrolysis protein
VVSIPPERPREPTRNLVTNQPPRLVKVNQGTPRERPTLLPAGLGNLFLPASQWVPPWRGALLWVLPTPLLWGAVIALASGHFGKFLADAAGFLLLIAGAWLTQRGLRGDHREPQARFARLWRWPRKTLGGILTALGAGVTAHFAVGHGVAISLAFAAVAALGFHWSYGFEPLVRWRPFGSGDAQTRRVAAALAEAEGRLLDLEHTAATLSNPELKARLTRLGAQGRGILDQIADRPTDLYRARKFLNVYLEGVQQVAEGYARTHQRADSRELEQNFRNVLVTVEEVFAQQRQSLLETDVLDLDIQIEVLKKQLEREGIA